MKKQSYVKAVILSCQDNRWIKEARKQEKKIQNEIILTIPRKGKAVK